MIHRLGPRLSVARFRSGFLATLIPVLTTLTAKAEVLISATLITEYDLAYFQNLGFNAATNGVQVLKLTYNTVGIDGMPTIATAAYVDPITTCATPLVCYFHGTVYQKDLAPSNWQDTSGVGFVGYYFGSTGMACVFPDFLGLGDSSGPHPYLHASTEASASIDAVRAAREYRMQQGNPLHEQLFLFGASAGSHACLATAQVMQTSFPDEFNITAAGNVSGPYALYPVFRDQLISMQPYGAGANLLYALFSYSVMYPGLFPTPSSFLVPPFSFILPNLFDGTHDVSQINSFVPPVTSLAIPSDLLTSITTDPNAPLNLALQENNVFNWQPHFPMRLYYCGSDESVPPENTFIAHDTFVANGASDVSEIEISATVDHIGCGELARPLIVEWFQALKVICDVSVAVPEKEGPSFSIAPNPANLGSVTLSLGQLPESGFGAAVRITSLGGALVYAGPVVPNGQGHLVLSTRSWPSGFYVVEVQNQLYSIRQKLLIVDQ